MSTLIVLLAFVWSLSLHHSGLYQPPHAHSMNSTRSARTKANQINYAELLADETELTELDDDDVSPDRAGPSTTTHTRAQTRGNKRKDVTTVSSTGKLGGTSTKAKRGKRKAVEEKNSKPKDEDVDMDTKDTTRGGKYNINRLLTSTASPLVNLDMHVSFYILSQLYQVSENCLIFSYIYSE